MPRTGDAGSAPPPAPSEPHGPHVRLGLAWATVTLAVVFAGPVALASVLAPTAGLAAAQAARSWRGRSRRPAWPVAAGGAALVVAAAAVGVEAVLAVVVVLAVLVVTAVLVGGRTARDGGHARRRRADPLRTGVIAVAVGLAGAGPVLLRGDGLATVFVLLALAHVYDASAYVVGTGAPRWEGIAAGVASIGAVSVAVAAVLVPPFEGATPWVLGLIAAVLAPLGPLAADNLVGDRRARLPALRRIDSLLLLGPLWALAAAVTLE